MSVTETGPLQTGLQGPVQERIYRRLLLVGPGAASFYRDACRLMLPDQQLEATTHVVSHLLREIESTMRGVLAPIAEVGHSQITASPNGEAVPQRSSRRKLKGDGAEKHKQQIRVILKALSIRDDEPVGLAWLKLAGKENSYALHSRAHRDSLSGPRPVDADFHQFWDQIQAILDRVLDRFEARYCDCVNIVDELLRTEVPTCADAKALRQQVPNNPKLLSYFLQRAGPAWVGPLRDEGLFSRVCWPWSEYLSRVAQSGDRAAQERVTEIVLNGKDIEDHVVAYDLANAALAMPPDLAARLVANESAWIDQQQRLDGLLPDKLGALISHLAKGGEHNATLDLARSVLAVLPDPNPGVFPEPQGRMDDWDYQQILEMNLPDLVRTAPEPGLKLLCELLDVAVRSSFRKEAHYEPPEDISTA